jgi:hypothetical protein
MPLGGCLSFANLQPLPEDLSNIALRVAGREEERQRSEESIHDLSKDELRTPALGRSFDGSGSTDTRGRPFALGHEARRELSPATRSAPAPRNL